MNYTILAPIYDPLTQVFAKPRERAVGRAALQEGEQVLIVGAGTGLDLEYVPSGLCYTAIDLTKPMLDKLEKRAEHLHVNVDARVMDAMNMEFPDATFDVAIVNLVLSVVPDPQRCLSEVARVVRPGGRCIILDKFAPEKPRTLAMLDFFNPVASFLGTNINRTLPSMIGGAPWRVRSNEGSGPGDVYRIVVLERAEDAGSAALQ